MRTLDEILEDYLNKRNDPKEREQQLRREMAYRRGYHQGWDGALETILHLWESGVTKDDAYAMCAMHVNGLARWRSAVRQDGGAFLPPASFDESALHRALGAFRGHHIEALEDLKRDEERSESEGFDE